MKTLRVVVLAVLVVTGLSITSAVAVGQGPPGPGQCGAVLNQTPFSGPPGTVITLSGALWQAKCDERDYYGDGEVTITLAQKFAGGPVKKVEADERGSWSSTLTVPSNFAPYVYA